MVRRFRQTTIIEYEVDCGNTNLKGSQLDVVAIESNTRDTIDVASYASVVKRGLSEEETNSVAKQSSSEQNNRPVSNTNVGVSKSVKGTYKLTKSDWPVLKRGSKRAPVSSSTKQKKYKYVPTSKKSSGNNGPNKPRTASGLGFVAGKRKKTRKIKGSGSPTYKTKQPLSTKHPFANSKAKSVRRKARNGSVARKARNGSVARKARNGSVARKARNGSVARKAKNGSVARKAKNGSVARKGKSGSVARKGKSGSVARKGKSGSVARKAPNHRTYTPSYAVYRKKIPMRRPQTAPVRKIKMTKTQQLRAEAVKQKVEKQAQTTQTVPIHGKTFKSSRPTWKRQAKHSPPVKMNRAQFIRDEAVKAAQAKLDREAKRFGQSRRPHTARSAITPTSRANSRRKYSAKLSMRQPGETLHPGAKPSKAMNKPSVVKRKTTPASKTRVTRSTRVNPNDSSRSKTSTDSVWITQPHEPAYSANTKASTKRSNTVPATKNRQPESRLKKKTSDGTTNKDEPVRANANRHPNDEDDSSPLPINRSFHPSAISSVEYTGRETEVSDSRNTYYFSDSSELEVCSVTPGTDKYTFSSDGYEYSYGDGETPLTSDSQSSQTSSCFFSASETLTADQGMSPVSKIYSSKPETEKYTFSSDDSVETSEESDILPSQISVIYDDMVDLSSASETLMAEQRMIESSKISCYLKDLKPAHFMPVDNFIESSEDSVDSESMHSDIGYQQVSKEVRSKVTEVDSDSETRPVGCQVDVDEVRRYTKNIRDIAIQRHEASASRQEQRGRRRKVSWVAVKKEKRSAGKPAPIPTMDHDQPSVDDGDTCYVNKDDARVHEAHRPTSRQQQERSQGMGLSRIQETQTSSEFPSLVQGETLYLSSSYEQENPPASTMVQDKDGALRSVRRQQQERSQDRSLSRIQETQTSSEFPSLATGQKLYLSSSYEQDTAPTPTMVQDNSAALRLTSRQQQERSQDRSLSQVQETQTNSEFPSLIQGQKLYLSSSYEQDTAPTPTMVQDNGTSLRSTSRQQQERSQGRGFSQIQEIRTCSEFPSLATGQKLYLSSSYEHDTAPTPTMVQDKDGALRSVRREHQERGQCRGLSQIHEISTSSEFPSLATGQKLYFSSSCCEQDNAPTSIMVQDNGGALRSTSRQERSQGRGLSRIQETQTSSPFPSLVQGEKLYLSSSYEQDTAPTPTMVQALRSTSRQERSQGRGLSRIHEIGAGSEFPALVQGQKLYVSSSSSCDQDNPPVSNRSSSLLPDINTRQSSGGRREQGGTRGQHGQRQVQGPQVPTASQLPSFIGKGKAKHPSRTSSANRYVCDDETDAARIRPEIVRPPSAGTSRKQSDSTHAALRIGSKLVMINTDEVVFVDNEKQRAIDRGKGPSLIQSAQRDSSFTCPIPSPPIPTSTQDHYANSRRFSHKRQEGLNT